MRRATFAALIAFALVLVSVAPAFAGFPGSGAGSPKVNVWGSVIPAESARGTPMQNGSFVRATPPGSLYVVPVGSPAYKTSCMVRGTLTDAQPGKAKRQTINKAFFISCIRSRNIASSDRPLRDGAPSDVNNIRSTAGCRIGGFEGVYQPARDRSFRLRNFQCRYQRKDLRNFQCPYQRKDQLPTVFLSVDSPSNKVLRPLLIQA